MIDKSPQLVSILLPAYNGSKRIEGAIRSVIGQTYTNWELLVIDDGSIDKTAEIVDNFTKNDTRIKYIKNEFNLGIQKTLNYGLRESKGEYIARIDDDDIWCDKEKLNKQVDFLNTNPKCVLVGTGVIIVDKDNKELLCISRECISPEEEILPVEPEPICGNHVCEKNETESSQRSLP